jgi:thymidylate kinase
MVILGKAEREKFESDRLAYSDKIKAIYDEATTYHDGKWLMIEINNTSLMEDIKKLLLIKRKPNKK